MTIQELLQSVDIENVLPAIRDWYYSDNNEFPQEEGYRKAYAILCSIGGIEDVPENMRIDDDPERDVDTFILNAPEDDFKCPWCTQMEFRYWEESVHKEVACADGLEATPEQMAAVCLWHLTFQGFDADTVRQKVYNIFHCDTERSENVITITYQKVGDNYAASISDNVPGTIVFTVATFGELFEEAINSIESHVDGMLKDGDQVPEWLRDGDYDLEFVQLEEK